MDRVVRAVACVAALIAVCLSVVPASAQSWPTRPVKFIIPFGPGAGADIGARLIQEKLSTRWGQPVVIENRPGGDSMIAIQAFLSANDDHTFLWAPAGNFTVHPTVYSKLPYDPADIIPIARFSNTILAVGVPASMNIKTLKEFVARGHAENGKWNGTAVPGITDFAFDYFAKTEGLNIAKVPYRDTVQAANDLGEGRIQVYASSYAILRPQTQAGRIKVLAVMSHDRVSSLPDLPSAGEEGYPALEMEGLVGLFGIKDMSDALREKIAAGVLAAAKDKAVEDKLHATAQQPNSGGPKEFAESIARQKERIATIAKAVGIKAKQ